MALIAPNLRTVFADPTNETARESMMLGSTLAGIAFSNASVALVHGMSRPIGAAFHVPHGLSNAMLLPAVTAFSIPSASVRYAQCARAMGVATQSDSDEVANQKLINELKALNTDLQVPTPADFGIDKETFFASTSAMAEQALASGSPATIHASLPLKKWLPFMYLFGNNAFAKTLNEKRRLLQSFLCEKKYCVKSLRVIEPSSPHQVP